MTNRGCNYLSESTGGRPIDCSGNTFVKIHQVGPKRKEMIYLHASCIDVEEREILVYIGGQDTTDVANFIVPADDTVALFKEQPVVLGKGKCIWVKVPAGNVNLFGRVVIC